MRVMRQEAAGWSARIGELIGMIDMREDVGVHNDLLVLIGKIRETICEFRGWIDGLIVVDSVVVLDVLDGKLVKSVSGRDRARLLKEIVGKLDEVPRVAICEHQGSRIGGATPTFNLAVAHQLCYHYSDTSAEFVSINSGRKNRIALAPHLTLELIAEQHGRKIRRDPAAFSSDQKKAARKLHTAENMKWFCKLWRSSVLDGIKPGLINHVADAFMQMLVYHFSRG